VKTAKHACAISALDMLIGVDGRACLAQARRAHHSDRPNSLQLKKDRSRAEPLALPKRV